MEKILEGICVKKYLINLSKKISRESQDFIIDEIELESWILEEI